MSRSALFLLALAGCPELEGSVPAAQGTCDHLTESRPEPTATGPTGSERAPWCHEGTEHTSVPISWDAGELAAMSALYGTDTWAVADDGIAHGTADYYCDDVYSLAALTAAGASVTSTTPGSGSYGESQSDLGPLSLPATYSLLDGLDFSCRMCGYYPLVELPADDVLEPVEIGKGMTWLRKDVDAVTGVVTVGCDNGTQCDPIDGDTSCNTALPLLCFSDLGMPQPASVPTTSSYFTWSGGVVATTPPVAPFTDGLSTLADADALCASEFGPDWRTAEFHDGWGWNFLAYGNVGSEPRFWVDIDDQPDATCWN
ncbi:MAG: hypothetical protein KTR31_32260 [Myxococcales bacterium]|nr:hypothetical protein [Myxococcales bacterium]